MQSQTPTESSFEMTEKRVKQIKIAAGVIVAIGLAVLVYALVSAVQGEEASARWDELGRLQARYESTDMRQDPLFEGPGASYQDRRDRYLEALESFLTEIEGEDKALSAQIHWLIAKVSADQVLSMKDDLDAERRRTHWNRAKGHLETLRDEYPSFQTNWTTFAPMGQASLTRDFLSAVEANIKWEKENLPSNREPAADLVALLRTERGDLRVGLYRDEAKDVTDRFVEHALRGDYDGTAFFAKSDEREDGAPQAVSVRGGHPATRGAEPFNYEQHQRFDEAEDADAILPAPARWLIPFERGIVGAWHEQAADYDGAQQFLVVGDRSPRLDYRYTPFGKLLDAASQETVDRIFGGAVWGDDLDVTAEGALEGFLQAPVKIVKVLIYENGHLKETAEVAASKAPLADGEKELASVKSDAYLADAPQKPAPEPSEEEKEPEEPGEPKEPGQDD